MLTCVGNDGLFRLFAPPTLSIKFVCEPNPKTNPTQPHCVPRGLCSGLLNKATNGHQRPRSDTSYCISPLFSFHHHMQITSRQSWTSSSPFSPLPTSSLYFWFDVSTWAPIIFPQPETETRNIDRPHPLYFQHASIFFGGGLSHVPMSINPAPVVLRLLFVIWRSIMVNNLFIFAKLQCVWIERHIFWGISSILLDYIRSSLIMVKIAAFGGWGKIEYIKYSHIYFLISKVSDCTIFMTYNFEIFVCSFFLSFLYLSCCSTGQFRRRRISFPPIIIFCKYTLLETCCEFQFDSILCFHICKICIKILNASMPNFSRLLPK